VALILGGVAMVGTTSGKTPSEMDTTE